jgi:hypothetical protein
MGTRHRVDNGEPAPTKQKGKRAPMSSMMLMTGHRLSGGNSTVAEVSVFAP